MTIVDMQAEEVCLHPRSFWLQIPSGGVVHAIRVKLLSLGQMVKVLNSCSSVTPTTWPAKAPLSMFSNVPPLPGRNRRQLRLCQNPNQHLLMNKLIKYAVQTPSASHQATALCSNTQRITRMKFSTFVSILAAQAFSSFYLRMAHNLARLQPLLDTEQYFFLDHACVVRM